MTRFVMLAAFLAVLPLERALAWGPEGHSIVAEVAQREISDDTRKAIDKVLDGASLASISAWADDVKFTTRKDTYAWHYVDIPLKEPAYKDEYCKDPKHHSDSCVVKALNELKTQLRCGPTKDARRDALAFVAHLIGDSVQPLHTVEDMTGGNDLVVTTKFCGMKETNCPAQPLAQKTKFHALWDGGLINATVWSWGSYVDRLYDKDGWVTKSRPDKEKLSRGTIDEWATDTHEEAREVWTKMLPADNVIGQDYYEQAVNILDRQLGIGGFRLARYLDEAYAIKNCPQH
jgi:hypothetical protein